MPQRLYSVLKTCQRTVGLPQNMPKNIKLPVIACTQCSHSAPTAFPQCLNSVRDASTSAGSCCIMFMARTHRSHSAHSPFSQRTHSILTAIIAFKILYIYFLNFEQPNFVNIVIYFHFSKQFIVVFNSC